MRGGRRHRAGCRHAINVVVAAGALTLLGSGCAGSARGPTTAAPGRATVTQLVDGDTLDVRVGGVEERVRLIGIDTPETVDPRRPAQCFGAEASAHLAQLLPVGTQVRLERDEVSRDPYDRLLAYVFRVDDDLLVNLAMVEEGYADAVSYGDNEALGTQLSAAESRARSDGRGLWSACGGPDVPVGSPTGG